tara:strand:+ start:4400 stop:4681 length:282 start_codon:yes stop_codon:yes gene_type:complete
MMGVPTTERTTAHLCIGDVMRSTQYYGQTRRFVVVDTTPKTVRVREIRRWGLDDLAVKRVREDGTFKLGPWQVAYLENPEKVAAGAYAQDFPW